MIEHREVASMAIKLSVISMPVVDGTDRIHEALRKREENLTAIVALLCDSLAEHDLARLVALCRAADPAETLYTLARKIEQLASLPKPWQRPH